MIMSGNTYVDQGNHGSEDERCHPAKSPWQCSRGLTDSGGVDPKWGIADCLRDSGSRSRLSGWPGSVVAPVAGGGTDEETRPSR